MNTKKFLSNTKSFFEIILSISGYVPKHATIPRTIIMLSSLFFSLYLTIYHPKNFKIALIYFVISLIAYIGFITLVLRKNGYRLWFIKKWGEEKGYLIYEGMLGFLFFNTAASISYFCLATSGELFFYIDKNILSVIVFLLFSVGFVIKIWSTIVTSVDTYYWKDMFLRRKISEYKNNGPYKYINNPMYSVGQFQTYAVAIYYESIYGLIAAFTYQLSIYLFYYFAEKKFVNTIYKNKQKK